MKDVKAQIFETALGISMKEKLDWEQSLVFITSKVAFNMKELLRTCRKNYWGIFDNPIDPFSGREKIWEHLTKVFVDFVVKNTDSDLKELGFIAKHPNARQMAAVVRSIMYNSLGNVDYDEDVDISIRQKAIDGTVVWANEDELKPRIVNLLNFGIAPDAFSIADAYSIQERMLPSASDFKKMAKEKGWINYQDISGGTTYNSNDPAASNSSTSQTPRVELYKRVGYLPEFCITGKESDRETDVPTEMWFSCSAGKDGTSYRVHEIKRRDDNKKKGYEEAWHIRVANRWYGEGVAERLIWKQIQENTNINVRQNRAMISQAGIFLIRQGSGITQQMIQKLAANGVIPVTNLETDVKQLEVKESSQSSYQDSTNNYQWGQKLSGAFEASTGESLGATTATVGVIQNNSAQAGFNLIKEGWSSFQKRWIKNIAWPIISKKLTVGELVQIMGDEDFLAELDEHQINSKIYQQLQAFKEQGRLDVDPEQVLMEMQRAKAQLKAMGGTKFVKLLENPNVFEYDVEVVGNIDKLDIGLKVQNLIQFLSISPELRDSIAPEIYDLLGMGPYKPSMVPPNPMQAQSPTSNNGADPISNQTEANTFEGFGVAKSAAKVGAG